MGIARSAKSSAHGGDRFELPDDNDDRDDDDDVANRASGVRSRVRARRGRAVAADFEDDDNFFAKIEAQSERPGGSVAPVQERRPRKPRHELHEEDFEELEGGGRRGGGRGGGDVEFSSREATAGSRAFGQTPFGKPNTNLRRGDSWDEGGDGGRLQEGQRGGHVKQGKGGAPHRETASHYGRSDDTYDNDGDDDNDEAYLKRATPARATGGGQARARDGGDYSHRAKDDFAVDYGYKRRDGERGDSGYKRRDRGDFDHRPREGGDYGYKRRDGDRGDFGYKRKDGGGGGGGGDGGYGYRARNSGGGDYGYKAKDDFGVNYGYRGKNGGDRGYDRGRDQRGPPGKARGFPAGAPWEKSEERGPWRRSDPVSGQRSEDAGEEDMLFGIAPVHMALLHGHREFRRLLLNRKRNPERPELQELLRLAAERGIETELVNRRRLDELSEGRPNQGVCLEASRRDFIDYDALFAGSADVASAGTAEVARAGEGEPEPAGGGEEEGCDRQADDPVKAEVATDDPAAGSSPASETAADGGKRRLWVVINEVNDPMNLGAVLRSTYFMGVETVLITKQNSCSLTPTVSKASAGTVEVMDIYTTGRLPQVLQEKAKQGWQIVGTVAHAKSTGSAVPVVPCDQYQLKAPTILLIGNEGYGLSEDLLALCDVLLTIEPRRELHRGIESLNLSVATGILLYNLLGKAAEEKKRE